MKFVMIAILSSVVSIVTWESLHVVYHIDEPTAKAAEVQKLNN